MYREYVLESADIYVCLGTYPLIPDDALQIINSDPSSLILGKYFPIVIHLISLVSCIEEISQNTAGILLTGIEKKSHI